MADYRKIGTVAIIAINNPPVNALSHAVRAAIVKYIKKAEEDSSITSIVICGQGKVFCAGADIKEFSDINLFLNEPHLISVIHTIEDCNKPVIAAIKGLALGGGLEVALACHYRIAEENTRFGFPEVLIGILPGATGTQRLPRVAGLTNSCDLILSGRYASAKEAYKMGILDQAPISGNLTTKALEFARSVASKPVAPRRVSNMPVKEAEFANIIFEEARKRVMKRARGAVAPLSCLRAIEASLKTPTYMDGVMRERELSQELMTGAQSSALQYAFFAERTAQKWELPGGKVTYKTTKPLPIKTMGVIGCGTMGTGITISCINVNIPVTLIEVNKQLLDRGMAFIKRVYDRNVKQGRMSAAMAKKKMSLVNPTLDYGQLANVDCVIEAVFENMKIKKEIFKKLNAVCKPSALMCSNTSSLNIDEIASVTTRPDKVVGAHFFSPAHIMKLLENIRGKDTSPETIATVMTFGKTINKIPVLVGNCPAFVANRMHHVRAREAMFLVEEGCLPHEVDQVLEDFGFPLGICKVSDLAGLDIGWRIRQEQGLTGKNLPAGTPLRYRNGERYCPIIDILCEQGRFGQKTGKGIYKYERPGAFQAMIDSDIEDMIVRYCRENGIVRRRIPYQEILERSLYAMINEGFRILEDGMASRMEDIDTIWLYGYGWPRHTGGPMYYATRMVGLPKVYERILYYQSQHPDMSHWQPSDLLKKMATQTSSHL